MLSAYENVGKLFGVWHCAKALHSMKCWPARWLEIFKTLRISIEYQSWARDILSAFRDNDIAPMRQPVMAPETSKKLKILALVATCKRRTVHPSIYREGNKLQYDCVKKQSRCLLPDEYCWMWSINTWENKLVNTVQQLKKMIVRAL